jgi:hypothetical protein
VLVDFDDFVAPESFGPPATPLRDRYLSRGVRFLGGPGTDGGAILNWRSNFSVTGYSGANFLAFNGIVGTTVSNSFIAALPEWILFTNPVAAVSIRVGSQESGGRTIHLNAFNIANATVATSSLVLGQALQTLSVSAPGIVRVEVGGSDVTVMVLDDLRFTADVVVAARETSWGRIKASYR